MHETKIALYSSRVVDRIGEPRIPSRFCRGSSLALGKECFHALDNFRDTAGLVVPGDGQLLHAGWLYPHPALDSFGCPGNKLSDGAAGRSLTRHEILRAIYSRAL